MFIPVASSFVPSAPAYPGSMAQPGLIPGRWVVAATLVSIACVAALLYDSGLSIDPRAPASIAYAAIAALALGIRYALRDPRSAVQRVVRDVAESFGMFMVVGLLGAAASYPLAAETQGSIDPILQRIDAALHFDWIAWYELVAAHRSLQWLGYAAYQGIFLTPALILGYFAWADKRAAARGFLASFWVSAVLCLALFRLWPAIGPLATQWRGPLPYLPESGLYEADLIPLLRDHALHDIDLSALRGLVSAPSFHTASAVLFIATAWPFTRLRWPVLAVSIAMLLSTPVEGTHYLADMLAGAAVAVVALALVAALRRRLAMP